MVGVACLPPMCAAATIEVRARKDAAKTMIAENHLQMKQDLEDKRDGREEFVGEAEAEESL